MNFKQAAALYKMDLLPSEKMVDVAMAELEAGSNYNSIINLAIEAEKNHATLDPLFEKCLRELEIDKLSNEELSFHAAKYYASLAENGSIDEITFGFKIGGLEQLCKLNGILHEAFQRAMWYEEAPYEVGYPEDFIEFRKECSVRIWEIIHAISA